MPTPNMGITLPVEGNDNNVWDTILNNALEDVIDPHDHTTGKGVKVPSAGLNINANLPFASFSPTGVGSVDFNAIAAPSSGARRVFFVGDDAWIRNGAGVNVQITSGGTLNASVIGGIGGDYASSGALVDYDNANDVYRFRQETAAAVRQYARRAGADVDLYEYKAAGDPAVPGNRVRLSSPAALAASYALTFPAAVPGSTQLVQVTSAGVLSFSNTIASAVTFSGLTTHNAGATVPAGQTLTSAGTMTVTGTCNITAAGAISIATLTTTTAIKHSHTLTMQIHAAEAQLGAGVAFDATATAEFCSILLQVAVTWSVFPISGLKLGDRITAIKVYGSRNSGAGTITANFRSISGVTGGITNIASDTEAAAVGAFTLDMTGLTTTVTQGTSYYVRIQGGGTTGDIIFHVEVTYDRP